VKLGKENSLFDIVERLTVFSVQKVIFFVLLSLQKVKILGGYFICLQPRKIIVSFLIKVLKYCSHIQYQLDDPQPLPSLNLFVNELGKHLSLFDIFWLIQKEKDITVIDQDSFSDGFVSHRKQIGHLKQLIFVNSLALVVHFEQFVQFVLEVRPI